MDDSFSLIETEAELCEETENLERVFEVKHFVFEDLLDTNEKLLCKRAELGGGFCLYKYFLFKESRSFFSKNEEKELGCYLCFKNGSLMVFEDFNFKVCSLEQFTPLVEAVEVSSGVSFFFELCNLCELPESLPAEQKILLTLHPKKFRKLLPLSTFDQLADENREILKLAEKGNEKALEKLEREIGEEESLRLLREVREHPERIFDTYIFWSGNEYRIIGLVTGIEEIRLKDREFLRVGIFAEELDFTAVLPKFEGLVDGDRIEVVGIMRGFAVFNR